MDADVMLEVDRFGGQEYVKHPKTREIVPATEVFLKGSLLTPDQLGGCPDLEPSGQKFECRPRLKFLDEEHKETKKEKSARLAKEKDANLKCQFCTEQLANRDSRIKHERLYCEAEGFIMVRPKWSI